MSTNSAENQIILYDLPSKGKNSCWSLNPWKARAALNFKNISYRTEWIEYPDLAPTFKSYGIPPNDPGSNYEYSSPVVYFPGHGGYYIMESRKIAEKLDQLHPDSLNLHTKDSGETIDKTQAAVLKVQGALAPIAMPRVPERILNPKSAEYFQETRAKRFGMPLAELAKSEKAEPATVWSAAEPGLQEIAGILKEDASGPYILGKEPSFADLIVGGFWVFLKKLDEGGDLFEKGIKMDKAFEEHFHAVGKWFEKDD